MAKIISKEQLVADVTINDIPLQICFHIIPQAHISSDLVIGREILSQGVKVILSALSCTFVPSDLPKSVAFNENEKNFGSTILRHPSIDENSIASSVTSIHARVPEPLTAQHDKRTFSDNSDGDTVQIPDVVECEDHSVDLAVESVSHFFSDEASDNSLISDFDWKVSAH